MVQKAVPGQPLVVKAPEYNAAMEAGEWFKGRQLGAPKARDLGGVNPCTVKVRNDTGGDLSAGDVVELGASVLTTPERRAIWLSADVPSGDPMFAVVLEAIPSGGIGVAQAAGICLCKVDIDDASHKYASVESGQSHLVSAVESGDAVILWQPGSTGVQECVVKIDRAGTGGGASWPLVRLYSGSWKSQYSTTTYLLNGYPADCKYTYYNGDASACGITITGDGASAYNTPLLTFNASGGEYLIIPNIVGEINDSGVSYTQSVTTGAASAGTSHTHDVDCPIRHFAFLGAYLYKRASGATLWGAAKASSVGTTAVMQGNVYNGAANGVSVSASPMYIRDIAAGDELLLRCFAYHTPSSGTVYFTYVNVELTIIRVLEDDTQNTVT